MKKQFLKQMLIIVLIIICGTVNGQEAISLKYGFTKGKTYVQNVQIQQNTVQTMGGQEIKIFAEIKARNEFNIEDVAKDPTALVSALNASVHTTGMGRDTTLNFNDLKYKIRVVYSNTGKIVSSVKVDSSEVSAIVDQLEPGKLKLLPGKEVRVGEKWQETTVDNKKATSGNPFTIEINNDTEYTLAGKETKDGKEYFRVTYNVAMTVKGKGTQMGMEMFIEGTGKTEGFMYFDPKASMVVYSEDNTEMEMNIAVAGPQNMTIPMTQSIKSITTFEEKK